MYVINNITILFLFIFCITLHSAKMLFLLCITCMLPLDGAKTRNFKNTGVSLFAFYNVHTKKQITLKKDEDLSPTHADIYLNELYIDADISSGGSENFPISIFNH